MMSNHYIFINFLTYSSYIEAYEVQKKKCWDKAPKSPSFNSQRKQAMSTATKQMEKYVGQTSAGGAPYWGGAINDWATGGLCWIK